MMRHANTLTVIGAVAMLNTLSAAGEDKPLPDVVSVDSASVDPAILATDAPEFMLEPALWGADRLVMPAMTPAERMVLLAEDMARDVQLPPRVGVTRWPDQVITPVDSGTWTPSADGTWTWRLTIEEPGANAMRLHLRSWTLPDDVSVIIGDPDLELTWALRADLVCVDGSIWTPTIPGSVVCLEYQASEPAGVPPFEIVEIGHIDHRWFAGDTEGGAGCDPNEPCHTDPWCISPTLNEVDAVGRMLYEKDGLFYVCSGTMMNSSDGLFIPYFLTAYHCLSTQASASSLEVTWAYHNGSCGAGYPNPSGLPKSVGSTLLSTSPTTTGTDMTFLQLSSAGASLYAGWTTGAPSGELLGYHHPAGCGLRGSKGTLSYDFECVSGGLTHDRYYYGNWSDGMTEGGSSGSALLNSSGHVVGQLFGKCGFNFTCATTDDWNWVYGRFDVAFPLMSPFLSDTGSWADFGHTGSEDGSPARPFNTVNEVVAAANGGKAWLKTGSTSATMTISTPVTLDAYNGPVTIGD